MHRFTASIYFQDHTMSASIWPCTHVASKLPVRQQTNFQIVNQAYRPRMAKNAWEDKLPLSMRQYKRKLMSTITIWPISVPFLQLAWSHVGPLLLIWESNLKTLNQTQTICLRNHWLHLIRNLYSLKPLKELQCRVSSSKTKLAQLSEPSHALETLLQQLLFVLHKRQIILHPQLFNLACSRRN